MGPRQLQQPSEQPRIIGQQGSPDRGGLRRRSGVDSRHRVGREEVRRRQGELAPQPGRALHHRLEQEPQPHVLAFTVVTQRTPVGSRVGLELLDALPQPPLLGVRLPSGGLGIPAYGIDAGAVALGRVLRLAELDAGLAERAAELGVLCLHLLDLSAQLLAHGLRLSPRVVEIDLQLLDGAGQVDPAHLGLGGLAFGATDQLLPVVGPKDVRERRRLSELVVTDLASRLHASGDLSGRPADLGGQVLAELHVNVERLRELATDELAPLGGREGHGSAQQWRDMSLGHTGQRVRRQRDHPAANGRRQLVGILRRLLGRHEVTSPGRSTVSTESSRPHQRQTTARTDSSRVSVSSTRGSPESSRCQNSRVVAVRTTSKRVRFPQALHRHRWEGSGRWGHAGTPGSRLRTTYALQGSGVLLRRWTKRVDPYRPFGHFTRSPGVTAPLLN